MRKAGIVSLAVAALACAVAVFCSRVGIPPRNVETNDSRGVMPDQVWTNSLGMEFVPVSGTEVLFCKWETRVQDFEAFVKDTGYDATKGMCSLRNGTWSQNGDTWQSPGFNQGATHPVCGVNWDDANAFCSWLTKKERDFGMLAAGQKYRLPCDWEWSVAVGLNEAKKGTPKEKDNKIENIYPWGTNWPPPKGAGNYAGSEVEDSSWPVGGRGWWSDAGYNDSYKRTSPAGSFNANKHGLYDMGGNVWEWCEDCYDVRFPVLFWQGGERVRRGGTWCDIVPCYIVSRTLLSSHRSSSNPDSRHEAIGFRCVVESSSD